MKIPGWLTQDVDGKLDFQVEQGHDFPENLAEFKPVVHYGAWLKEKDPTPLDQLCQKADAIRKEYVGDEVHLRSLIEFSNHCARRCGYCGLNPDNRDIVRVPLLHERPNLVYRPCGWGLAREGESEGKLPVRD
ncbi:hypothetical protein A2V82_01075 [candidate division KSB1 bacterium RBG_16_48_16]|nr:MAG: hypothetical protein A2V82_01075 [candidate division KSB1 bacterium RBG_16_48_16]